MSFAFGVHPRYRYRIPLLADALHILQPNMYPDHYDVDRHPRELYQTGI